MSEFLLPFYSGSIPSELSADFILPDTYPDVKRILRVKARPMQLGRFVNGGRLEFTGAVDYIVTFSSECEESPDSLHAVHFASEYQGMIVPDEPSLLSEGCEILLTPTVTACSARLANPRKLSLKATVVTDAQLSAAKSSAPRLEGVKPGTKPFKLERKCETLPTLIERQIIADHVKLSENLEPDPSQPAIDEIITCDAELHFCEAKPQKSDGSLTFAVKGEAVVDCVYKAQSEVGDYRSFTRKLPLSYVVGADDCAELFEKCASGTLTALAYGGLSELNASVGENSYGERRVLELDLSFDIGLRILADAETELTLDAYSTECESSCELRRLELTSLGKALTSNFSVSEAIPREKLTLPDSEVELTVVDAEAELRMNTVALERGRAQLTGEASVSCILSDRRSFTPVELKLPLRCELAAGELSEPVSMICDCAATDLRVRIDKSRLSCDFETALNVVLLKRRRVNSVETVELGAELTKSRKPSELLLCYPEKGEELWSVAKRYRTTCDSIRAANPTVSEGARVMIIPG